MPQPAVRPRDGSKWSIDRLLRRTLVALITSDVHARDITETMHLAKVDSPTSFTWQMQLRFQWVKESGGKPKVTFDADAPAAAPAEAPAPDEAEESKPGAGGKE